VTPLLDGESYSQLSRDGKQIIRHSFKTGEETEVLFDVNNIRNRIRLDRIDGYQMSPDEKNILLRTKTKGIYRHSSTAEYYIYNVKNRTLSILSEGGPQEQPLWSRDGTMIAFVREGNLFLVKLLFNNSESQITKDGEFNKIINGKPDWVNEEEFSFARAFDFNADNTMLAWIRYDETEVPMFCFPWYKGLNPEMAEYAGYPGSYDYKYPIAGAKNSVVSVHTFDIKSRAIRQIQLPISTDSYVPRIFFTDDAEKLLVLTLNRHQNQLDIYLANPRSTECRVIVREQAECYVTEEALKNFEVTPNGFVLMSQRSGYKHLYHYDLNGTLRKQLTNGNFDVTSFYGYDTKTGTTYFASNQESPLRKSIYKSDAKGRMTRLSSSATGTNSAIFSRNFRYYMNTWSDINTPTITTLCDASGKTLKTLEDNAALRQKLAGLRLGERKFFTFTTSEGIQLNGFMVLPADFNPSVKYPVVMHQYSGPGSQQVVDSWNAGNMGGCLYEQYLAQEGFICVCVDGRGTGGRGRDFEQCTYLKLGQLESRDQVEAAIWLGNQTYVDKSRIAIWGWSFGGFNTLMSMSEGRPVFAAGVAVAAPTSWRYYDTVYTERFMRTPNENGVGYDDSPISRASKLSGSLLLIHGLADDNVHFRNAAEYTEALVQADKDFRELVYTNRNHSIYGGNTRNHLFRQITQHFKEMLR
ncbi:MAG: DPP IV N-terminal domain-containing protein, partial [Bacteroidaceae bacterium]|nr:DPP IV N-terminal domain-containing protein [Bacteroidaceae bacterium]